MRQLSLLALTLALTLPAAAQLTPWDPPDGWEIYGDRPLGYIYNMTLMPDGVWLNGGYRYQYPSGEPELRTRFFQLDTAQGWPGTWILSELVGSGSGVTLYDPQRADTLFQGFARSLNGGATWHDIFDTPDVGRHHVHDHHGTKRLITNAQEFTHTPRFPYYSDDAGTTWTAGTVPHEALLSLNSGYVSFPAVAGPWGDTPAVPLGRIVTVSNGYGAAYSDDGGATWLPSATHFGPPWHFQGVALVARPGGGLRVLGIGFVGGGGCGCFRLWASDDGGVRYTEVRRFQDPDTGGVDNAAALLPVVPGWATGPLNRAPTWTTSEVLLVSRNGVVWRSSDGGTTWAQAEGPLARVPREVPPTEAWWRLDGASLDGEGRLYPWLVGPSSADIWMIRSTGRYVVAGEAVEPTGPPTRLTVRPSPAASQVAVDLGAPARTPATVEVVDVLGRAVARREIAPGASSVSVDVSAWPPGVYVARVTDGDDTRAVRLTVVR